MIRSRRVKGVGVGVLLLLVALLTQSGGLAFGASAPANTPIQLASGDTSAPNGPTNITAYKITGGGGGTANLVLNLATNPCVIYGSIPGADWISATDSAADCVSNLATGQTTTYSTTFELPAGATNVVVSGSFLADNQGSVSVNGTSLAAQSTCCPYSNFQDPATPFSSANTNATFTTGTGRSNLNTLSFTVVDQGVVSGLDYSAVVNYTLAAPGPVQNLQAAPGSNNAVLSWEPPADTGGVPLDSYHIAVTDPSNNATTFDPAVGPATGCPEPSTATDCQTFNVPGLTSGTQYTVTVQAHNTNGVLGPIQQVTATPSANSASIIVPPGTAGSTNTCTNATTAEQACGALKIPANNTGGVFSLQDNLPSGSCGSVACKGPALGFFGSAGCCLNYKQPEVLTYTMDTSTLTPKQKLLPVLIPLYYQVGSGSFGVLPFCKLAHLNWALPTAFGSPGAPVTGSACISLIYTLISKDPAINGDVRAVINFTSDSDGHVKHP